MNKQNSISEFEYLLNNDRFRIKLSEFLGWHIGDGCISINKRYSEYALTGDLTEEISFYKNIILPNFNQLFNGYFNKEIKLKEYNSNGVCGVYLFDKGFVNLLQEIIGLKHGKKINTEIPSIIKTKEEKISFLRGLFDTDGSIYYCKSNFKPINKSLFNTFHYKAKIKLATISKNLIDQVYQILHEFGFSPRMRKPSKQRESENTMFGVVLYRKADIIKWIDEIGFRNPKHTTKVQLWRKFGFCPAKTNLNQRLSILKGELNPLTFYPNSPTQDLKQIKIKLTK